MQSLSVVQEPLQSTLPLLLSGPQSGAKANSAMQIKNSIFIVPL